MSAIQDIFRMYGPEYLALYGDRMPENHKKVMNAICECRSGSFGTILPVCRQAGMIVRSVTHCIRFPAAAATGIARPVSRKRQKHG